MTRCPGHLRLGETLRDVDFHQLPLLKGHGSTPLLRFPINVGHHQQAVFPPTRTSQWLFGDWGRAGRGAGEPGLASEAASLAGPPGGLRSGRHAAVQDQPGSPPTATPERHKEEEDL